MKFGTSLTLNGYKAQNKSDTDPTIETDFEVKKIAENRNFDWTFPQVMKKRYRTIKTI